MTIATVVLIVVAIGMAFANGANDNFKGVATLLGSGTSNYRTALLWGTFSTLLGSVVAVYLATRLVSAFSGKGLVPDQVVADPTYLTAVAAAAGVTVLLATRFGLPVSTTHGLVGGLVGAGMAAGRGVNFAVLATSYLGPLLVSPLLAIVATVFLYRVAHRTRLHLGIVEETCFCIGTSPQPVAIQTGLSGEFAMMEADRLTVQLGTDVTCRRQYSGLLAGMNATRLLNSLHYLSGGVVSFARGLNDTPKIAALLATGIGLSAVTGAWSVSIAMALGGLLAARRVAETMSHRITPMNSGQGFTANLVTGLVVLGASRLGVPVSTTHVSCGSIFGVGAVTSEAKLPMIARIATAWVLTLPVAAAVAAAVYWLLG
ncbi:MAG: anion permease [Pirellulales bacterium]